MGLFFAYIIKSTICIALFYLFYRLLLSKDTFHRFNRVVVLSLMLFAALIPFIKISTEKAVPIQNQVFNMDQFSVIRELSVLTTPESTCTWGLHILIIIYLGGVIFFLVRLFYSIWTIFRIVRSGTIIGLSKNIKLIITERSIEPFSWMQYIVISSKDWEDNKDDIIAHEMVHIRYRHSCDVFIFELYTIFHWFNPAAWLLKNELQDIHEYEADKGVINQGIDAKKYQLLLIEKAVGTKRFNSMANSFNHSKLEKRITMMLKKKSNAWARLKYLYVLPLTAIATVAFASPEISNKLDKISNTKISELPLIKETFKVKKEQQISVDSLISTGVNMRREVQKREKMADIIFHNHLEMLSKNMEEKLAMEQAKIQEVYNNVMSEINQGPPSPMREKELNKQMEMAIKDAEQNMHKYLGEQERSMEMSLISSLAANEDVLIIIDGARAGEKEIENLRPEDVKSVNIQRNRDDIREFGDNLEGVILIETKNN